MAGLVLTMYNPCFSVIGGSVDMIKIERFELGAIDVLINDGDLYLQ